eukprot:762768-Hanusia_phi.AAC.2
MMSESHKARPGWQGRPSHPVALVTAALKATQPGSHRRCPAWHSRPARARRPTALAQRVTGTVQPGTVQQWQSDAMI